MQSRDISRQKEDLSVQARTKSLAGRGSVPLWRDARGQGAQYKMILHCPVLTEWPGSFNSAMYFFWGPLFLSGASYASNVHLHLCLNEIEFIDI
jgi:hypothetical protein